jgi:preprotein translocase subunit YajC
MHSLNCILFALAPPGPGGEGPGALVQLFPLLIVFGIFYVLLIRPQNRQRREHEAMLKALKKGDKVVTNGGIHGTISGLMGDTLKLRIADQVSVILNRAAVATKVGEEEKE